MARQFRLEIELSAKEQDPISAVGESAEAAGGVLQGLIGDVESLARGIRDPVENVAQEAGQISLEQLRHLDHRHELAPHRPGRPLSEDVLGNGRVHVLPERVELIP